LAGAFRARLVLDFHDTSYTWQDLLARHDTWLESFPRSSNHDAVQRTRTGIKKVLEIERELSRATADLESGRRTLAEAERIRALVLNLRNERFPYAHRLVLGARDIHPEEPVSTDGTRPIDRLRAEGLKAVPALIDALGDRTLTRSLGYSSRLGNSDFRVLEFGRLAEDALIGISGAPVAVAAGEQRKQAWQTWLETARTRGIQATHARLIHRDGYLSFRAARSYVDRWPEDLDVILRAIESSPRAADTGYQYQRYSLLEHIARKTRDPRVNALLRTDLENTTAMFRWWAADILLGQGDRAWIAKLVRHWQRTRQPMVIGREDAVGSTPERVVLVGILMRCGDPEAWNALGAAMDSPVIRLRVLQGLQSTPRDVLIKHVAASDREAVDATLERILVGLLADDEPRIGLSPTWRSSAMHAASFADIAACALAHYWPHRYQFDPAQTASVRRRQIVHLRNAHRQEGEPLTPLPPLVPRVVRSDDPAIETLLQRIREAASGWRDDVQQLAGIGQGALPGMIDTLDELPANRQTSKALAAAALNLSNRIAEVAFGASAKEIPQSLRQQATSLRGQQVSEKLLWSLLIDVSHSASRRERAGRVHLERTGAGGGFSVRIEMPSEQPRGEGSSYDQSITAAGVGITYGSWSATQAKIDDAASIDDQGAGAYLRDALATPAGKGVEISLTLQLY
jgi:hypothetical protein